MDEIKSEISEKLLKIYPSLHEFDPSSEETIQFIQEMLNNKEKEEFLLEQKQSINELLDTFLALQPKLSPEAEREFVPETHTLSPSYKSHQVKVGDEEMENLADYRAELNREARKVIEDEDIEIYELKEVIKFLLGNNSETVISACKEGRGVETVQSLFQAKDNTSLIMLSESDFGINTEREIEEATQLKTQKKSEDVKENIQFEQETNYERILRENNLKL